MGELGEGLLQPADPYVTLDGSVVTELLRPERGGSRNLSVAEAVVQPGDRTRPHLHRRSDEVYYVLSGKGLVTIEGNCFAVEAGGCTWARAGQVHSVGCVGPEALRVLCLCAPPYTHDETLLRD